MSNIRPVILSGGSGTRLWPLSLPHSPKQFLRLTGELSMLQYTVQRVLNEPGYDAPVIVANAQHRDMLSTQLRAIGVEDHKVILEPLARNTAAAIALAAVASPSDQPLLVMPSDHVIQDVVGFRSAVESALPSVRNGLLVTFGITPQGPETGFGYIQQGAVLETPVHKVQTFVEKPNVETASAYLAEGGYLWNGGIFLFRAGDYVTALSRYAPEVLDAARKAVDDGTTAGIYFLPEPSAFGRSPSISVDYAVMEKADNVAVVPLDVGWSDVGSWDALYDHLPKDDQQNVMSASCLQIESEGCLLKSEGPMIATVGVQDLIVVASSEAVLVVARGESQEVKALVDILKGQV